MPVTRGRLCGKARKTKDGKVTVVISRDKLLPHLVSSLTPTQLAEATRLIQQVTAAHSARTTEAEAALKKETGHNADLLRQLADIQRDHEADRQQLVEEKCALEYDMDTLDHELGAARKAAALMEVQCFNLAAVIRVMQRKHAFVLQDLEATRMALQAARCKV